MAITIFVIAGLIVLSELGVNITPLIAAVSVFRRGHFPTPDKQKIIRQGSVQPLWRLRISERSFSRKKLRKTRMAAMMARRTNSSLVGATEVARMSAAS